MLQKVTSSMSFGGKYLIIRKILLGKFTAEKSYIAENILVQEIMSSYLKFHFGKTRKVFAKFSLCKD